MINKVLTFAIPCVLLGLSGCASTVPFGAAYTNIQLPIATTDNSGPAQKIGVAECKSYLVLIATGDCSINTAKKNGGITKVNHVDWSADNVLGIVGTYKLTVYGE